MLIKPLHNQILVRPVTKKQTLVREEKSLCEYGEVLAIGSSVGGEVKIGDTIGFVIWGINKLQIENETHYFVPDDPRFLLGVITKD